MYNYKNNHHNEIRRLVIQYRKIVTKEILFKINFFHLSPKNQIITVPSLGRPGHPNVRILRKYLERYIYPIKIENLLVANNLF